ncbi:hypothetical protein [Aquicella siphonis]|nr:hypothetical protein [Aquicella siphonis]
MALHKTTNISQLISDPAAQPAGGAQVSREEEYIRRVFEPRTPEDLALALQNPRSPAYRDMMNMLIAGMAIDLVMLKLIERYLQHRIELDEKEREELKDSIERESLRQKEFFARPEPLQGKMLFGDLQRYNSDEIKIIAEKCWSVIQDLQEKIETLDVKLTHLERDEVQNLRNWQTGIQKRVQAVTQKLEAAKTPLYVRDAITREYRVVNVRSEQAQAILVYAYSSPPPPLLIRELSNAFTGQLKNAREQENDRETANDVKMADDKKIADEKSYQLPTMEDAITKLPQNQAIAAAFKICLGCINDMRAQKDSGVEEINWGSELLKEIKGKNKPVILEAAVAEVETAAPYKEQYRIMVEKDQNTRLKAQYEHRMEQEASLLQRCSDRYQELAHKPLKLMNETDLAANRQLTRTQTG